MVQDDAEDFAENILNHMLIQESIPLDWITYEGAETTYAFDDEYFPQIYHSLYCVCDSNDFDYTKDKLDRIATHTCVYVQAENVKTKWTDI